MNRLLTIIFVILLLFITAEAGFLLVLNRQSANLNPPSSTFHLPPSTLNSPTSNPSLSSDFKILYQEQNDKEGRTVIYETKNNNLYRGVGWNKLSSGKNYLVGQFSQWGPIQFSKDKILLINNPLTKSVIDSIKVVFEPSKFFTRKIKTTQLTTENLSVVKNYNSNLKGSEDFNFLVQFDNLSSDQLSTLIKKGDALVIIPLQKNKNGIWEIIKDENNRIIASQILIRRWSGAKLLINQ